MNPKTKQTDFKFIDKMSHINHNVRTIKNRISEIKTNSSDLNESIGSNNDETSTSYAVNNSEEILKSSLYRAKEFTIKTRNHNKLIKTNRKEGATKTPSYFFKAKLKTQNDYKRKIITDKNLSKCYLLSILKPFGGKQKLVKNSTPNNYLLYIGSFAIVVLLSFSVLFAAVFGGDNSSYFGAFIMPFDNPETVSRTDDYGWRIHPITGDKQFHTGIDFGTPHHCNIYAAANGEVTFAGVNGGYGNCVIIRHEFFGDTITSLYAHLSEIKVIQGQMVLQGEIIGIEGGDPNSDPNPGTSTGHHLHFEIRNADNQSLNPADFLMLNY